MFDTGALIALERGHRDAVQIHRAALERGSVLVTITPVVAEWWRRGHREKERSSLLRTLTVEAPNLHVARLAGCAIGEVGATVVDAMVMAAASIEGDTVLTSDVGDLESLNDVFPNVLVTRV